MNILFVTDSFPPHAGGAGWATYNLAKELKKKGHSIHILKPCAEEKEFNEFKIHTTCTKLPKEFAYLSLRKEIEKLVKEHNIRLVVATYLKSALACKKIRTPFVTIIHDYWPICYKGTRFDLKTKRSYEKSNYVNILKSISYENKGIIRILSPIIAIYLTWRTKQALKSLRKSKSAFFNSEHTLKKLKPYIPNIPTHNIYNIFPEYRVDATPEVVSKAKNSFLFVGKLNTYKGAEILIEVAKRLPNTRFTVAGWVDEKTKKRFPSNITFLGYLTHEKTLGAMKNATALLVPSIWEEPLGMIAVESLMVGTPAIVSNQGGLKEIVENNKNGLVVEPTAKAFNNAIEKMQDNKFQEQLAKNTSRINTKFNNAKLVEIFLKEIAKVYKK